MRVALAVVAEEVVEAVLQRAARGVEHAHAPLAHAGGGVTVFLEDLRHRDGAGRQRELALGLDLPVGTNGAVAGVLAEHERRAARGAHGGPAVTLGEARALLGHAVQVGRLDELLPVAADVALGEVIAEDEDDVRFARFGSGDNGRENQKSERGKLHGVRELKGEWRAESRTEWRTALMADDRGQIARHLPPGAATCHPKWRAASMADDGGLSGGLNRGLR